MALSARGIDCKLLSADECREKFPLLKVDDLEGGLWVPEDGVVSPKALLKTLVDECRKNNIVMVENCEVNRVLTTRAKSGIYHKVRAVETSQGLIECDYFVNCAGIVSFDAFEGLFLKKFCF